MALRRFPLPSGQPAPRISAVHSAPMPSAGSHAKSKDCAGQNYIVSSHLTKEKHVKSKKNNSQFSIHLQLDTNKKDKNNNNKTNIIVIMIRITVITKIVVFVFCCYYGYHPYY